MSKRAEPKNPDQHLNELKRLLNNFEIELKNDDLRLKVQALIPAIFTIRDLGSSLVSVDLIESAKDRIIRYLKKYPQTIIPGEEIMVIAGIDEWARRVRELRVELGWQIITGRAAKDMAQNVDEYDVDVFESMRPNDYMLLSNTQDREAAHRWNIANSIRKQSGSVKEKLLAFFRKNVGKNVTGEELRYIANDKKEWARRVRELRSEEGWPILTQKVGRPDLAMGEYILEVDRQLPTHDRKIEDKVRAEVLQRDNFSCTNPVCKWSYEIKNPADPRQYLELHHVIPHIEGGLNSATNLITLCNVCHDRVHANDLKINWL